MDYDFRSKEDNCCFYLNKKQRQFLDSVRGDNSRVGFIKNMLNELIKLKENNELGDPENNEHCIESKE